MTEEYLRGERLYRHQDLFNFTTVLQPAERSRPTAAQLPQQAAAEFLVAHATDIGIDPAWLTGATGALTELADLPESDAIELAFEGEKRQFDTRTVAFLPHPS